MSRSSQGPASKLASLQSATSLSDVARLLHFKPAALSYLLYKLPAEQKYTAFEIPKRSGGVRKISAPIGGLKLVQRRLSIYLQDCVHEIALSTGRRDHASHGFVRERSIVTNAEVHRRRRHVFNVDIADFFPSINFGRIRAFFMKNRHFALSQQAATVLAQIATHENALPQGSPCSPVVSNLIAHILDISLIRIASASGCTYSRYADDLTFSTNKRTFPPEIATQDEGDPSVWIAGRSLRAELGRAGFALNESKTRMQYRHSRQEVTGLVVNKRVNVRSEYRRTARAMVDRLVKNGAFQPERRVAADVAEAAPDGTLNHLHGVLGFIDHIDVEASGAGKGSRHQGSEQVYRRFLIYKDFYKCTKPVILCEGQTDNVYLTHAIRALASEFPLLASVGDGGKVALKVRLYKCRPKSRLSRILRIQDGGSSTSATFITNYIDTLARFDAPGLDLPVLLVYDQDAGAKPIKSALAQLFRGRTVRTEPFVHVDENLYTVATPLIGGKSESRIEDFFDDATKRIQVGGKTFDPAKKADRNVTFDKTVFAHKVIRAKADSIDFGGFRPLLQNLSFAIRHHAERRSAGILSSGEVRRAERLRKRESG